MDLGVYTLRIFFLRLLTSDLDLYLIAVGVCALGVDSLGLQVSGLKMYVFVFNTRCRRLFKPSLFREYQPLKKRCHSSRACLGNGTSSAKSE